MENFPGDEGRQRMSSSLPSIAEESDSITAGLPQGQPQSHWRSVPLGVVGMIVLIVAVEANIMRHDTDLTTLVASNWQLAEQDPKRYASQSSILCFGDSMVKFGVQPRVLGGSLGRSVHNFALYCGPPQTSFYQLERAFATGARPAAILVDYQPEILMCDALRVTSRTFPEILGFTELLDLCWTAHDFNHLGEFVVARYLPSARKRFEIRAAITAASNGQSAAIRDRLVAARRNWKVNDGAEVLPKNPHFDGTMPKGSVFASMFWTPWKANKLNVTYLERFLNLAARHHVPVFWLLQPNAAVVIRRRDQSGYSAQYDDFVRGYQKAYPNLYVIDGRPVDYPTSYYTDPVHLDRSGATAYSLGIADALRPYLNSGQAPPRWQILPDRRDRANEVSLEDWEQSAAILQAQTLGNEPVKLRR